MIKIDNVCKTFGKRKVLNGISMTVPTGTVTVILGPSGSGKTTFLRTINFLGKADEGILTLDDGMTVNLNSATKKEILAVRRRTAMVFQSYNLFSNMTAIENVMEGMITVKKIHKKKQKAKHWSFCKKWEWRNIKTTIRCNFLADSSSA